MGRDADGYENGKKLHEVPPHPTYRLPPATFRSTSIPKLPDRGCRSLRHPLSGRLWSAFGENMNTPPSACTQLNLWKSPGLMTEREVRIAGITSNRLCTLRDILSAVIKGCTLSIATERGGHIAIPLTSVDTHAIVGLLKERDEQFLTSLNIELDAR